VHWPAVPSPTRVQVMVLNTVVEPTSRVRSLTVPPAILMGAHVSESSSSNVVPLAAVLLSFNVKVSSGNVSPTTRFNVVDYAIFSPY